MEDEVEDKIVLTDTEQNDVLGKIECRHILKEIMDFGVTQHQILSLIYLLSLELEDNLLMKEITNLIK